MPVQEASRQSTGVAAFTSASEVWGKSLEPVNPLPPGQIERLLSYLPLAHAAEVENAPMRTNELLKHHEQLRFIVLCNQPWTPENGVLMPTLKVRRAVIEERFGRHFAEWDGRGIRVIWIDRI